MNFDSDIFGFTFILIAGAGAVLAPLVWLLRYLGDTFED